MLWTMRCTLKITKYCSIVCGVQSVWFVHFVIVGFRKQEYTFGLEQLIVWLMLCEHIGWENNDTFTETIIQKQQ